MDVKTVLVVDDNEDNRFLYHTMLSHVGYTVLEAHHGAEGVELAREYHPDLVLMDLAMPVLDGWGATRQIKAHTHTADIPVCAVTAFHFASTEYEKLCAAGFCGYLQKPFPLAVLLEEVQSQIGPP
jgi:CheY-like chemotaxis protein